ncbi:hypothetical protein EDB86DRAFT_3248672 [Lactarius hatsudake]|nr:hypothetical protein EDB86DRAFT_3248672 [Lactarius hatsudake]
MVGREIIEGSTMNQESIADAVVYGEVYVRSMGGPGDAAGDALWEVHSHKTNFSKTTNLVNSSAPMGNQASWAFQDLEHRRCLTDLEEHLTQHLQKQKSAPSLHEPEPGPSNPVTGNNLARTGSFPPTPSDPADFDVSQAEGSVSGRDTTGVSVDTARLSEPGYEFVDSSPLLHSLRLGIVTGKTRSMGHGYSLFSSPHSSRLSSSLQLYIQPGFPTAIHTLPTCALVSLFVAPLAKHFDGIPRAAFATAHASQGASSDSESNPDPLDEDEDGMIYTAKHFRNGVAFRSHIFLRHFKGITTIHDQLGATWAPIKPATCCLTRLYPCPYARVTRTDRTRGRGYRYGLRLIDTRVTCVDKNTPFRSFWELQFCDDVDKFVEGTDSGEFEGGGVPLQEVGGKRKWECPSSAHVWA